MTVQTCRSCSTPNEADARFCENCGSELSPSCAACGTRAPAKARFCRSCGTELDGTANPPTPGPTRKTVSVLFADLAGSTGFEERVDAETTREVLGRYHGLLRSVAEHHRAGQTKYIGDGFMAVWGVPETGPDDAGRAVDAAVELQERFGVFTAAIPEARNTPLTLRVAVNTGEVVVGSDDADLVGDVLNVGARLESECALGGVVVGEETWRCTRGRYRFEPMGRTQVKGRAAPVAVYRWLGDGDEVPDSTPFVGRADEMHRLQIALDSTLAARSARLVTVIGDPGVGKSRLAVEFAASRSDVSLLHVRCAADGMAALGPFVEMLRRRDIETDVPAGVLERDRILRGLRAMTAGLAGSVEETFWALRRYIEVQATRGGLILILDDIQWADALLLDFVEHLAEWIREVPVLMLGLTRAELREHRPELLAVGGWVADAVGLGGLEPHATAELAARVLGSDRLPPELLSRLPVSTGGNPLFVRELVGMLVQDGVLVRQQNDWRLTIDVGAISVPPTIQALLASRLESLHGTDRRMLEIASVVGTEFSLGALSVLAGSPPAEVRASLKRLRRLELAEPSGTYAVDEPLWRFHHILIRDVAYRRLLKSERAALHQRTADWLLSGGAGNAFDADELVARHLEAACGYRRDLGRHDADTAELALQAARSYLSSARRALDRDELVSAGAQAVRGAPLAAQDPTLHAELLLIGCEALLSAGDVSAAAPLVDELEHLPDDSLTPWATCYRCQLLAYTDPERLPEVDDRLQGAVEEFSNRGDASGLAKAYRVCAATHARMGRIGDCETDLFEALVAARRSGDHRQITAALAGAPNAALWGPSPAPKAGGRCLDVVRMQRMTTAAPSLEATSLRCLAILELLRGRPEKARSMLADARRVVAELGLRHGLMETELFAGLIELMTGDPVAAEPHFRAAREGLDALGVGADAGQAAALLARSVLAQGRVDEADRYATESERLAGHNLKTAIAWRSVRAEILAAQGLLDSAVALAREAVAVAAQTDLVLDHADACLTLSRVLNAAGETESAADALAGARSLYAAKEVVFMAPPVSQTRPPGIPAAENPRSTSRLTLTNRATQILLAGADSDGPEFAEFAPDCVYQDQRKLSGAPIIGSSEVLAAAQRKLDQYPHFEQRVMAVRGEKLVLFSFRWWDDAGNETASLDVEEIGDDDALRYWGRFDDGDFASAYAEMEHRYYCGEGAAFASNGLKVVAFSDAMWRQDVEGARRIAGSEFRWFAGASALKPVERTIDDLFAWRAERLEQVSSLDNWISAIEWLSADCCVALCQNRGIGIDGDDYDWSRIYVDEYRDGLAASVREFGIDDEVAAFAHAQRLIAPREHNRAAASASESQGRLVVANRCSAVRYSLLTALARGDVDTAATAYIEEFEYDDRRRLHGQGITGTHGMRAAFKRLRQHYNRFEGSVLAVRGERLSLGEYRRADEAGNESTGLVIYEIDDQGMIVYEAAFDEEDFASAYAVFEDRYYSGEGAEFAGNARTTAIFVSAMDRLDIEEARRCCDPTFRVFSPPGTLAIPERTVDEFFDWLTERARQVSTVVNFSAVYHWTSPSCLVARGDVRATGLDGEQYIWSRPYVIELRDGLPISLRQFDDETAAFEYARRHVAPKPSRLIVSNRNTVAGERHIQALRSGDADGVADSYRDDYCFDDHRKLNGGPLRGRSELRANVERILEQYNHFDWQVLAVRGEYLSLSRSRWSDDAGNETMHLHVIEGDEHGRIVYDGRFDVDDFEGAYQQLEWRYYAGEGAPFTRHGLAGAEFIAAMNRGDFDMMFDTLVTDDLRVDNHSGSAFPDRSLRELRSSFEDLASMLASVRMWLAAVCWLSPTLGVSRLEREGHGEDGEEYRWARILVTEWRDGRMCFIHEFEADDEDTAFSYAEALMDKRGY